MRLKTRELHYELDLRPLTKYRTDVEFTPIRTNRSLKTARCGVILILRAIMLFCAERPRGAFCLVVRPV